MIWTNIVVFKNQTPSVVPKVCSLKCPSSDQSLFGRRNGASMKAIIKRTSAHFEICCLDFTDDTIYCAEKEISGNFQWMATWCRICEAVWRTRTNAIQMMMPRTVEIIIGTILLAHHYLPPKKIVKKPLYHKYLHHKPLIRFFSI